MATSWAARVAGGSAAGLRLTLLGRFRLERGGRALALRTRKEEGLLAYLVLHPGSHPREVLAELYWGDTPEEQARGSLRGALADLRAGLGGEALASDRMAVQFCPPGALEVDVWEFRAQAQRLLGEAGADPDVFDPGVYSGELLAGHYEEWVLAERERLRQLYLDASLRRVGRLRGLGRCGEALAAAQQVLAEEPAEERAHQQLIGLYALSGNRPAALRQLEMCRRALKEALDVAPSAETLALLETMPAAAPPAPPEPAPAAAAGHLPAPLTSFIGRAQELAALGRLLEERGGCRLVTLTGAGGSGKTRLAIELARQRQGQYRQGAWWVDLSALRDGGLVADSALRALGVTPGPGQPALGALMGYLRERQVLLVLDNCEHLLEASGELVAAVLQGCPAVQVLATSREPLGVPGEQLWPVPTFAVPAAGAEQAAEHLLDYDAVRLFVERARMQRPGFGLGPENAGPVAEICRRLDGIPLAIELAAARVRTMDLGDVLLRLQSRLRLLASGSAMAPPRQQTLRASIDWSYNQLTAAECVLLQRLAVFVGGWTLGAAEAVCAGDGLGGEEVLDLLGRLVDRSLVVAEAGRYRLLETIREYALERLVDAGEAEAVRERHAAYFACHLDQPYEMSLRGEQRQAIDEIAAEIDNVRAGWAWAVAACREGSERCEGLLWRSAAGLTGYYELHSRFREGEVAYARAVEVLSDAPHADPNLLAMLRIHHGYFLNRLCRLREAQPELEFGCAALRQANLPAGLTVALTFLGTNAWQQGDYAHARDLLEESLGLSEAASDQTGAAVSRFFLGMVEHAMGNEAQADRRFQEGLAIGQLLRQPRMVSMISIHRALTLLALGQCGEAREQLAEGLKVARDLHDRWLVGQGVGHLGMVMLAQGDCAGARTALLEAVALARETGSAWDQAWDEVSLGHVYLAEGDAGQANAHYRSALQLAMAAGAMPLAMEAVAAFAELRAQAGDREGALDLARQVPAHPASTGAARARVATLFRMLDPHGAYRPDGGAAPTFEEIVQGILGDGR